MRIGSFGGLLTYEGIYEVRITIYDFRVFVYDVILKPEILLESGAVYRG